MFNIIFSFVRFLHFLGSKICHIIYICSLTKYTIRELVVEYWVQLHCFYIFYTTGRSWHNIVSLLAPTTYWDVAVIYYVTWNVREQRQHGNLNDFIWRFYAGDLSSRWVYMRFYHLVNKRNRDPAILKRFFGLSGGATGPIEHDMALAEIILCTILSDDTTTENEELKLVLKFRMIGHALGSLSRLRIDKHDFHTKADAIFGHIKRTLMSIRSSRIRLLLFAMELYHIKYINLSTQKRGSERSFVTHWTQRAVRIICSLGYVAVLHMTIVDMVAVFLIYCIKVCNNLNTYVFSPLVKCCCFIYIT